MDEHYLASAHDTLVGATPDQLRQAAANRGDLSSSNAAPQSSGEFDPVISKQAIGADAPPSSPETVFDGVRPMIVTKDSEAADAHAPDTVAQDFFHKVSCLQVTVSHAFIGQSVSEYMSKIFPWALEYT